MHTKDLIQSIQRISDANGISGSKMKCLPSSEKKAMAWEPSRKTGCATSTSTDMKTRAISPSFS